jgi:hypothetical protein
MAAVRAYMDACASATQAAVTTKNPNTNPFEYQPLSVSRFVQQYKEFPATQSGFNTEYIFTVPNLMYLLGDCYFRIRLGTTSGANHYVQEVGHAMIESMFVEAGTNIMLLKNDGHGLHMRNELFTSPERQLTYQIGKFATKEGLRVWSQTPAPGESAVCEDLIVRIRMPNERPEQSLPMPAMTRTSLQFHLKVKPWTSCVMSTTNGVEAGPSGNSPPSLNISLVCRMTQLTDRETVAWSQQQHNMQYTYLEPRTTQVAPGVTSLDLPLTANTHCRQIVTMFQPTAHEANCHWFAYSTLNAAGDAYIAPLQAAQMEFDGQKVQQPLPGRFTGEFEIRRGYANLPPAKTQTTGMGDCVQTQANGQHYYVTPFCAYPTNFRFSGAFNPGAMTNPKQFYWLNAQLRGNNIRTSTVDSGGKVYAYMELCNEATIVGGGLFQKWMP